MKLFSLQTRDRLEPRIVESLTVVTLSTIFSDYILVVYPFCLARVLMSLQCDKSCSCPAYTSLVYNSASYNDIPTYVHTLIEMLGEFFLIYDEGRRCKVIYDEGRRCKVIYDENIFPHI